MNKALLIAAYLFIGAIPPAHSSVIIPINPAIYSSAGGGAVYEESAHAESNGTSHSVDVSGFTITTDDLLVYVLGGDSTGTPTDYTCPSGFTSEIDVHNSTGGNVIGMVCYKVAVLADESATSYAATSDTSERAYYGIMRFSAANTASPIEVSTSDATTDSSTVVSPSLSSAPSSDSLVVYCFAADENRIATEDSNYPSGMETNLWVQQAADNEFSSSSLGCAIGGDGLTGSATWTSVLSAAAPWIGMTFAISAE